jgi:hypothetical protein
MPRMNGLSAYGELPSMSGAASLLARTSEDARKTAWPYAWEHCPPDGNNFYIESIVAFPSNGVLTELLSYPIPDGMRLDLEYLMFFYVGISLLDGRNLCTWQLATDTPANVVGITTPVMPSGYNVPYWGSIQISKGSPSQGPWPFPRKHTFKARDVVSVNVLTTNPFPETGGQFLTCLQGHEYPAEPSS